jgi:hypothetical protein
MNKHAGKIILNLTDTNSFAMMNGTELYYEQLREAYSDIKNDKEAKYLFFAFVSLCAATLEYSLNYLIVNFCIDKYGPHNYKTYYETYINISFKNKLHLIPTLLSDGLLVIDKDNPTINKLEELISLRNKILHNKEALEVIETPDIGATVVNDELVMPALNSEVEISFLLKDNSLTSLTKQLCLEFGDALGVFKSSIMTPGLEGKLVVGRLLKECSW